MDLDLTSFANAIAQLEEAIALYNSPEVIAQERVRYHMRAAAIQAFEFTYELSFKTLKRYLETISANPLEVAEMNFDEVIRKCYGLNLLSEDVTVWRNFRKSRGTTSHAYDSGKAQMVFEAIPIFLAEARFLHQQLTKISNGQ